MKRTVTRRTSQRPAEAVLVLDIFPGKGVSDRAGTRPAADAPVRIEIRRGTAFEDAAKALQQAHAALYRLGPKLNPRSTAWRQVPEVAVARESDAFREPPRRSKAVMKAMRSAERTGFQRPDEKQIAVHATSSDATRPARTIHVRWQDATVTARTTYARVRPVPPRTSK